MLIAPFIGFLHDVRAAGQYHDRTWEQVRKSGTLRVGMDAGVPPFAMPGNGDLQGFDPDLARDLAARLGLTVTIVNTPSDALYDALLTGKVDALIAALPVTPEFRRDVAYSAPYIEMGERAIVRAGSDIRTPADLAHRRVGVELGSDGDLAARTLARHVPLDLHSTYDSGDAALADLANGDTGRRRAGRHRRPPCGRHQSGIRHAPGARPVEWLRDRHQAGCPHPLRQSRPRPRGRTHGGCPRTWKRAGSPARHSTSRG